SQTKHTNTPTLRKIYRLHFLAFITLRRNSIRRKTEVIAINLAIKSGNSGSFQKSGVAEPGRVIGVKEKVACSG
ncbi:MAG TPA: hypothetical protein VK667_00640, partial [Ktedonobacteraceae bacterium]|nr:hypothetical protein [Ktedonobacteraceae bacterium]